MKNIIFLFTVCLIVFISPLFATHNSPANLNYNCIGTTGSISQYEISATLVRDCNGINAAPSLPVEVSTLVCGNSTLQLPLISSRYLTTDCLFSGPGCQGTEYLVDSFGLNINLGSFCGSLLFASEICCRNTSNILADDLYVYAETNSTCQTGFTSAFVAHHSYCTGMNQYFDASIVEPDGDSIVYSLVDCLTSNGAPAAYIPPFSGTNPFPSNGGVSVNSSTGLVTFFPTQSMRASLCVLAESFQNGLKVAELHRDILINTVNCQNQQCCSKPILKVKDVDCLGAMDGTINAKPYGLGPWDLNLYDNLGNLVSSVTTFNNHTFTDLLPGIFTITSIDIGANNCTQSSQAIVLDNSSNLPNSLYLSGIIDDGIYYAASQITAEGMVPANGNVQLKAADLIEVIDDLTVDKNADFLMEILECD